MYYNSAKSKHTITNSPKFYSSYGTIITAIILVPLYNIDGIVMTYNAKNIILFNIHKFHNIYSSKNMCMR